MTRALWLYKVTRPVQFVAAALGTWVVATLSGASDANFAGVTMGIVILASSIYHYGAANKMYARKVWDRVDAGDPAVLISVGIVLFATAITLSFLCLPRVCGLIVTADVLIVMAYAQVFSKHWITKNVLIAFVCTTPILLGWLAGNRLHPVLPYAIAIVFSAYWAREIVKDIRANKGIRVTLPIQIGIIGAMRIAGIFAAVSALVTASLFGVFHPSLAMALCITFAIVEFSLVTHHLFVCQEPARIHQDITRGIYALILSVVVLTLPL